MPNITIEGCNGTSPIFGVTRPPNFNGLVGLNYTFTINATTSGNGTTSVKVGDGKYIELTLLSRADFGKCHCTCKLRSHI